MQIIAFLIIVSLSFYIYYKIKYFRSKMPMERKMLNGKSSLALGVFVALFGLNQLILFDTVASKIIGPLFIIIGGLSGWVGFRSYRHHVPYALREADEFKK